MRARSPVDLKSDRKAKRRNRLHRDEFAKTLSEGRLHVEDIMLVEDRCYNVELVRVTDTYERCDPTSEWSKAVDYFCEEEYYKVRKFSF